MPVIVIILIFMVTTLACANVTASEHANTTASVHTQTQANYFENGITLTENGTYEMAIQEFTNAIELDPESSQAYFLRGTTYYKQKQIDMAIEDLSMAISIDPYYEEAYLTRSKTYLYIQDWDKSISDCNMLIQLNPRNEEAVYVRGLSRLGKKDYSSAVADLFMPCENDTIVKESKEIKDLIDLIVPKDEVLLLRVAYSTTSGRNCRGNFVPYNNTLKVHIFINPGESGIEVNTINIYPAIDGCNQLNCNRRFYHTGPEYLASSVATHLPPNNTLNCNITYRTIKDSYVKRSNEISGNLGRLNDSPLICPIN